MVIFRATGQREQGEDNSQGFYNGASALSGGPHGNHYAGSFGGGGGVVGANIGDFENYSNRELRRARTGAFRSRNTSDHQERIVDASEHSGIEGYGRYLSIYDDAGWQDGPLDSMEVSNSSPERQGGNSYESSSNLSNFDKGLEDYAKYLSSPPEDRCSYGLSGPAGDSIQYDGSGIRRFSDSSNGSGSDFEGLGNYSQPFPESQQTMFPREASGDYMESPEFFDYSGRLF